MPAEDPGRRRVLAALGAAAVPFLSGCGLFRPPDPTGATTETSTATPTATSTATTTATPTATATSTPERFDPGDAITVENAVFGYPDDDDNDDDENDDDVDDDEDGVVEDDNKSGIAVVDVDIEIRNVSGRSLALVALVVDAVYESEQVPPTVVATDTVSRRWSDGWEPDSTAVLTPEHLYFEQDGPPWYDLRDEHYSIDVTVRVVEPL